MAYNKEITISLKQQATTDTDKSFRIQSEQKKRVKGVGTEMTITRETVMFPDKEIIMLRIIGQDQCKQNVQNNTNQKKSSCGAEQTIARESLAMSN